MTDEEFLRYCEAHCQSPRAGFVKENLDRLFGLMGEEPNKNLRPGVIYPCDESVMLPWVRRARRHQELLTALHQGASWFREYADIHTAKQTPEAEAKARRNAERAAYLQSIVDGTPLPLPG